MKKNNLALVVGGASAERAVSKLSGRGIYDALLNLGYNVKLIDPALGTDQPENVDEYFIQEDKKTVHVKNYIAAVNSTLFDDIDIVFNGLHGQWGEDGTIQSLFEMKGIRYTGSGVLASSISMNKNFAKVMFKHWGVQTPKWLIYSTGEDFDQLLGEIKIKLKFPCVVKPNDQGSAIGLSICRSETELPEAIKLATKYSPVVILEEFIAGREITVGILNNHAFPVLEIKPKHEFYDYTCKYTKGMSEYIVPAEIPEVVSEHVKQQALLAYNSVGCISYGRIDFRLSEELKPYCLEVNTLPGMTSTSLLPKTAKAGNISFEELVERIVKNALNK